MMAAINDTERLIFEMQQLLPSVSVTEDDILNPKHEFVKTFCEHALNYYERKIGSIATNEELPMINVAVSNYTDLGYGPEVAVFARIMDIASQVSATANFTIMDFYKPSKQRTKSFLKIILNFLLYINNELQNTTSTVQGYIERSATVKELEEKRNTLLENMNEKARNKVSLQEEIKMIEKEELIHVNRKYDTVLEEIKKIEKSDEEAGIAIQKYQTIINERNDLLTRMTKDEKNLEKRIVVPAHLESLIALAEQLKQEGFKIKNIIEEYTTTANEKQKDCEYYAEILHRITGFDFDFNILNELKNEQSKIKDMEEKCTNLSIQIQNLEKECIQTKTKINENNEKKQQLILQKEMLKNDILKSNDDLIAKYQLNLKKIHNLEERIKTMKNNRFKQLQPLLNEERSKKDLLITAFEENYKKALEKENKQVTDFHSMLDALYDKLAGSKNK